VVVTGVAGLLVLAEGLYGERLALLALGRENASAADASRVMTAVVVLTLATAIAVFVRFFGATKKKDQSEKGSSHPDRAPAPQASEGEGGPGEPRVAWPPMLTSPDESMPQSTCGEGRVCKGFAESPPMRFRGGSAER
jgi:hypothetical protein